jgi:nucleosome assembly protein 1-like 1
LDATVPPLVSATELPLALLRLVLMPLRCLGWVDSQTDGEELCSRLVWRDTNVVWPTRSGKQTVTLPQPTNDGFAPPKPFLEKKRQPLTRFSSSMSDKQVSEQDTVVEVDQNDGRGFQPVDAVAEQVAQMTVGDAEEEEEDDLANLPKKVLLRLDALRKLQEAQAEVEEEFEKERKALELKYEKLYKPFYTQRAEIVSGAKEVEAAAAEPHEAEAEEEVKGVPGFWLRAFMNHSVLADLVQERDLPAFEFLTDVHSVSHETDNGFKLSFEFAENPFFTNKTLTKEYDIGDASELGEAVLRNVMGTVIEWKEGHNLCEVTKKVKQRAKGGKGETRVVSRTEPCESFFQFFTPVEMPSEEDDEDVSRLVVDVCVPHHRSLTCLIFSFIAERDDYAPAERRLRDRLHDPRDHHPAGAAVVHGRGRGGRRLGLRPGGGRGL